MDFDANEIRIVEGKASKKGITISKHFSIRIPGEIYKDGVIKDMEQLSYLIKKGMDDNKISKGNVHAVINSSIIIVREVPFPKVGKEDIDNLIQYQLGDFIPIHPEDYVVKYLNLGTFLEDGVEKLNMLVIGVPKDMVEEHLQLIKDLGLKPLVLDFKGNAISKLLSLGQIINDQTIEGKTLAFVDLSHESTGVSVIKNELIQVSRLIEGGLNSVVDNLNRRFSLSEDEVLNLIQKMDETSEEKDHNYEIIEEIKGSIQDIIDRVEMVLRYYRTRDIENKIDLLILHGPLSKVNWIRNSFSDFFNVSSISLESISKLKFDGDLSTYGNAIGGLIRINEVRK